jgi:hypothetical protein
VPLDEVCHVTGSRFAWIDLVRGSDSERGATFGGLARWVSTRGALFYLGRKG